MPLTLPYSFGTATTPDKLFFTQLQTDLVALSAAGWNNTRLAKTGAYTITNSDKSNTIALGGSAFYELTVSAASGYDADFVCVIANEDATRAKAISINGHASFYLWPLQSFMLFNQNNVWQFDRPPRWKTLAGQTFNVNHASGSNTVTTTDGLGTGAAAFATVQNAIHVINNQLDCNGFIPTIQVADATFTENSVACLVATVGATYINLFGNSGTPANVVWQISTAGLTIRDGGILVISGFRFVATASGMIGISVSQFGVVDLSNVEFGAFASGFGIQSYQLGSVNCGAGSYVVDGNCASHWLLQNGSVVVTTSTISLPNALTFTSFMTASQNGNFLIVGTTFSGTGAGAGSTGKKYDVSINATAALNGVTLPGATAGTTATGGQVV